MNELDEIQAFFAAHLRSRRALPKDAAISQAARGIVTARGKLSPVERLEIYREQFWLRHTSSLVEDFPGLSGILGQSAWQRLVEGYLDTHPPRSYTLRDLGLQFPAYVASQSWLEQRELCTDMARLELAYLEIFDAADAAPVSPEVLAGIEESAWERVRIELHPALRLLAVGYPVALLRRALIEAREAQLPARVPHHLLIFRRDLSLFHEPLGRTQYELLSELSRGVPLVPACETVRAAVPEAEAELTEHVAAWFQSWAARGFIVGVAGAT